MEQPKKKLIHKLRYKYRLVIINDESFEEKISFKLTPMNVFVGLSSALVLFTIIIVSLIFFTSLREFVPGYTDTKSKRTMQELLYRTDSLEQVLKAKELYYQNIVDIINGGTGITDSTKAPGKAGSYNGREKAGEKEEAFIRNFEKEQKESVARPGKKSLTGYKGPATDISPLMLNPAEGVITRNYNLVEDHYAIDIASAKDAPVKAVQPGTIIFAEWTPQAGNTIAIQHRNNLVSIYKHNSTILKKVGTFVETGDVIAIVGNSGEISSGPHLHFELWENGNSVNPEQLLNYN